MIFSFNNNKLYSCRGWSSNYKKSLPLIPSHKPKKIWVLINAGCGSSCELTVLKLRNHPHVSLVGQNTAGGYEYGNAGAVVLPYSKLILRLPRQHKNLLPEAQFELVGIPPDYFVSSEQDILEFVFKDLLNHQ